MKKRILFIVVLGLSFAPPVFAEERTGEQRLSQTPTGSFPCQERRDWTKSVDLPTQGSQSNSSDQNVNKAGQAG